MIDKRIETPTSKEYRKWAKMTDDNMHVKVRIDIAHFFRDAAREYYFLHEAVEEGTPQYYRNMQVYCDVTKCMLDDIKVVYGQDVFAKIMNCL